MDPANGRLVPEVSQSRRRTNPGVASVGSWLAIWERLVLNDDSSVCPVAGRPEPPASPRDYDADNDGLIEITNLAQLDVMRHNLNGDEHQTTGSTLPRSPLLRRAWVTPPPAARATELVTDLDFDANGEVNTGDTYWNDGSGWLSDRGQIGDIWITRKQTVPRLVHGNDHTISNLYIARNGTDYRRLSRGERTCASRCLDPLSGPQSRP